MISLMYLMMALCSTPQRGYKATRTKACCITFCGSMNDNTQRSQHYNDKKSLCKTVSKADGILHGVLPTVGKAAWRRVG